MAAAAAGTGTWAAQEKQFPPALLSFFIYNPRFGPREGEVRRGAAGTEGGPGGGPATGVGARGPRGAPSAPTEPASCRVGCVPGWDVSPGLDNAGRRCCQ